MIKTSEVFIYEVIIIDDGTFGSNKIYVIANNEDEVKHKLKYSGYAYEPAFITFFSNAYN